MALDDRIPLDKLPLNDLLGFLEINPPRIPYNSLLGLPSKNTPLVTLNEFILSSDITGFSMSLGAKLDPEHYAHLLMIHSFRSDQASVQQLQATFNADNAPGNAHYKWGVSGSTTVNSADLAVIGGIPEASAPANGAGILIIPNYLDTSRSKSLISMYMRLGAAFDAGIIGASWSQTAAIEQIDFKAATGNLKAGGRVSTYAFGVAS